MDPSPTVIAPDPLGSFDTAAPSNSSVFFSRITSITSIENILSHINYFMHAFKKFEEKPVAQSRRELFAKFFMILTGLTTLSWMVTSFTSPFISSLLLRTWNDQICTVTGWACVFTSMAYYYYNTGPDGVSIYTACMTFRLSAEESLRYNQLLQNLEELIEQLRSMDHNSKERLLLLHNLTYLTQKLSDRKKTTIFYAIEAFETIKLVAQNAVDYVNNYAQGPTLLFSYPYSSKIFLEQPARSSRLAFNERRPVLTHS